MGLDDKTEGLLLPFEGFEGRCEGIDLSAGRDGRLGLETAVGDCVVRGATVLDNVVTRGAFEILDRGSSSAFLLGNVFDRTRPCLGGTEDPSSPPLIWARRSPILKAMVNFFLILTKFASGQLLTGIASLI